MQLPYKTLKRYVPISLYLLSISPLYSLTLLLPDSHDTFARVNIKNTNYFEWESHALLENQQNSLKKAWCTIFCCGCCMTESEYEATKTDITPPKSIQVLQAATELARQIINNYNLNPTDPILINASGDAVPVACLATKLLEPTTREFITLAAFTIMFLENLTMYAIGIRTNEANNFRAEVKGSWDFDTSFKAAQTEIKALIPAKTTIRITQLNLINPKNAIPEEMQPSEHVVSRMLINGQEIS